MAAGSGGQLSQQEIEDISDGKNPYVEPHHAPTLDARNKNPIIGAPGTGAAAALEQEFELNMPRVPTAEYVDKFRQQLKHLQSTLPEKDPDITKLAAHINAVGRSILGIGNTQQQKALQDATDKVEADRPETPPFLKKFLPNNDAVDKAKARDAVRRGATPEQAAESVKKQNQTRADQVPQRNKSVLDLVPR